MTDYSNLKLTKARGYREFYEGHIDGVWFTYTPSLTQEVAEVQWLVPEDVDVEKKINNEEWKKAAFFRIKNSINYGYKFEKERPVSFLNGEDFNIKWNKKNRTLTIKEKTNE